MLFRYCRLLLALKNGWGIVLERLFDSCQGCHRLIFEDHVQHCRSRCCWRQCGRLLLWYVLCCSWIILDSRWSYIIIIIINVLIVVILVGFAGFIPLITIIGRSSCSSLKRRIMYALTIGERFEWLLGLLRDIRKCEDSLMARIHEMLSSSRVWSARWWEFELLSVLLFGLLLLQVTDIGLLLPLLLLPIRSDAIRIGIDTLAVIQDWQFVFSLLLQFTQSFHCRFE